MKQRDIVALLRKEFGHHEVTVFTASQKNKAGILDCEIAYKGQSFWVEIKILPDRLRAQQNKFIDRHIWRAFVLEYGPKNNLFEIQGAINMNHFMTKDRLNEIKDFFDKVI